ncbi:MAG: hypothetical protein N3A66_05145 [Planctomycetota bacterium]|nr:hypothetical protein [Planctomycetota bacterium]
MTDVRLVPRLSPFHAAAWAEAMACRGVEAHLVYVWEPAMLTAAIGLAQEVERELYTEALAADSVALLRRASGGGAVLLAPGMLCFGILAPPAAAGKSIRDAYRILLEPLIAALRQLGLAAGLAGISDIAAGGPETSAAVAAKGDLPPYKIAGCAQLRKRHAILVHGVLLLDADLALFDKYLRYPSEAPAYRAGRPHGDFCRNLSALLGRKITPPEVARLLQVETLNRGWQWTEIPAALAGDAEALYREKYRSEGWHWRRERSRV